jgi:predicted MFS family arabinose efflux permease
MSNTAQAANEIRGRDLFRDPSFLVMCVISLANGLGEKFLFVFIVLLASPLVSEHLQNSMMSGVSLAFALPAVVLGSVAGVLVDRMPLKVMLFVSNLTRALLLLSLPFAQHLFLPLLIFAFIFGALTQFYNPAFMTTVPTIVRKDHLMTANATFMTIMIVTVIGGYALAKPVGDLMGVSNAYLSVVGIYALAAIGALLVRIPPRSAETRSSGNFWKEWSSTFTYLWKNPRLLSAYTMMMAMFGTFAALNVLAKEYTARSFDLDNFGIIFAFAGAGMAIGAGIMGKFGRLLPKAIWVRSGAVVAGAALVAMAFARDANLAFALATCVGIAGAMIDIPISTMVQESVDEEMRGKVFGVQGMLVYIATLLPMVVVGPLADLWGASIMIAVLGVSMGALAFLKLAEHPEPQVFS